MPESGAESSGGNSDAFLRVLAAYLALKQSESQAKVHNTTLKRTLSIIDSFSQILPELRLRSPLPCVQADNTDKVVMGLKDFVRAHGNPLLVDAHVQFVQGVVDDEYRVMVVSNKPCNPGRVPLNGIVDGLAPDTQSARLDDLKACSVDHLESAKLIKTLISEYMCKEALHREVHGMSARVARPGVGGSQQGSSRRSPARPSNASVDEPCAGEADSVANSVVSPSAGSPPPQSDAASSHVTPRKASCRVEQPAASNSAVVASPSIPSLALAMGAKSVDRTINGMLLKCFDTIKVFCTPGWRTPGATRGKSTACNGLHKSIATASDSAKKTGGKIACPSLRT